MKVIIKIAWRNIWRNKVRSLVIIASIVLGLWAGTFVSALYYGMGDDRVSIAIENEISHIQIHDKGFKEDFKARYFMTYREPEKQILSHTPNVRAWSARSKAQGMIASTANTSGVQINGIDAVPEDSTTHLADKVFEGRYFTEGKANQVLVGRKLAEKLKLKIKSKIVLTFLDKDDNLSSGAFKVAGIYRSDNNAWDELNVFISRPEMNQMLNLGPDDVHEIAVLLNTNRKLDTTETILKSAFPQKRVESWKEIQPELDVIISMMGQASDIFVIVILLALSFGIINIMLMAVLERMREIGMMIALGMTRFKVFLLIVIETFFLVMIGCPIGMLLGFTTNFYFGVYGLDLSAMVGQSMSNMGFSAIIHTELPPAQYGQIVYFVIFTALISAIFPAIKAIRLNPAETIKS